MKKFVKRFFTKCLAIVLMFSLLTGCTTGASVDGNGVLSSPEGGVSSSVIANTYSVRFYIDNLLYTTEIVPEGDYAVKPTVRNRTISDWYTKDALTTKTFDFASQKVTSNIDLYADTLDFTNNRDGRTTPIMGWNSFNTYGVTIDENLLVTMIDAMVDTSKYGTSFADHGYNYFNVDDGYQYGRDGIASHSDPRDDYFTPNTLGRLMIREETFPRGMKYIADYCHEKGLYAGCYTDAGDNTCGYSFNDVKKLGYGVGLYGHEYYDINMFLGDGIQNGIEDWGFDFIKIDWCGGQRLGYEYNELYTRIAQAIDEVERKTGKDKIFNICCWAFPGSDMTDIADSWRSDADIHADWGAVLRELDAASAQADYTRSGHVSDPDMLEVGIGNLAFVDWNTNPYVLEENRSHFAMWCMISAPLVLGLDMRNVADEAWEIVTNDDLIAINQDEASLPARKVFDITTDVNCYLKPLAGVGEYAVALLNRNSTDKTVTLNLADLGIGTVTEAKDLWTKANVNVSSGQITVTLKPHDTFVYRIKANDSRAVSVAVKSFDGNIDLIGVDSANYTYFGSNTVGANTGNLYIDEYSTFGLVENEAVTVKRSAGDAQHKFVNIYDNSSVTLEMKSGTAGAHKLTLYTYSNGASMKVRFSYGRNVVEQVITLGDGEKYAIDFNFNSSLNNEVIKIELEGLNQGKYIGLCAMAFDSSYTASDDPGTIPAVIDATPAAKISKAEAQELIAKGAILVDVRGATYYNEEHIDGAINYPIANIDNDEMLSQVLPDKNQAIILYCFTGKMSTQAKSVLTYKGYTNVYNLGAMSNWTNI